MSKVSTKRFSEQSTRSPIVRHVHRKTLADGTVKTYSYSRKPKGEPDFGAERFAPGTIGALQALYRASPEWRALKPKSQAFYLRNLNHWEPLWHRRIEEIDRRQIISLRNGIAERRGDQAANVFVKTTGTWLFWLVENGWLPYSPATKIKRIPGGHFPAWRDADYQYAITRLPEHLRRAIVLACHTGQRRGDLIALTWADYDGLAIRLRQQKGSKARGENSEMRIPLLPEAHAELEAWKREATSPFMLTTETGRPWTDGEYLSRQLGEAVAAMGLPKGLNVHGLRKLAAATLAEAGCTTHQIAAITGHSTLGMIELYTKSARQEQLASAAIVQLADHRKKRSA
jgi:integrase